MELKLMFNKYRLHIYFSIAGAIVGYLLFHPYAMLVSSIMHVHQGGKIHLRWEGLSSIVSTTFESTMLPMAVAFACFGGIVGLLIGIVADRKKTMHTIELENEKRTVALEILKRLMVTLSHYLLNASMVIGGEIRLSRKAKLNKETLASLEVIAEQAKKIDAVISALRKVTEIKTIDYTTGGRDLMLDISEEMNELLNKK